MSSKIITGCYPFKKIGSAEDYVRLLCSENFGKSDWLESLRNQHEAIVLKYDGHSLCSEIVSHASTSCNYVSSNGLIPSALRMFPNGCMYFQQPTKDGHRIEEVLLLPAGTYGGCHFNRYRLLTSVNNGQYPLTNLYDLYIAGDLDEELNSFNTQPQDRF